MARVRRHSRAADHIAKAAVGSLRVVKRSAEELAGNDGVAAMDQEPGGTSAAFAAQAAEAAAATIEPAAADEPAAPAGAAPPSPTHTAEAVPGSGPVKDEQTEEKPAVAAVEGGLDVEAILAGCEAAAERAAASGKGPYAGGKAAKKGPTAAAAAASGASLV